MTKKHFASIMYADVLCLRHKPHDEKTRTGSGFCHGKREIVFPYGKTIISFKSDIFGIHRLYKNNFGGFNMKSTKILSLLMALVLSVSALTACGGESTDTTGAGTEAPSADIKIEEVDDNDAVAHKDTTSVYDTIGSKVTIDMVEEVEGIAYVTVDGTKYELGMDFLSMAMVYNTAVPANSDKYKTSEDVFNQWWKLYIQRWNDLAPEIPLYSNQYFDLYNAKIEGFVTTPYWAPADAIIASKVTTPDNSVILGSSTELAGAFRNSSWGKASPAASDLDIQNLTSGHATVMTNKDGAYIWNMKALAETPVAVKNDDGTLTYTIKIRNDLKFSDGSAITAKNYIAASLANSTVVGTAAGGTGMSGNTLVGFDAFKAYDGTNDGADVADADYKASKTFSGIKLLDDYTFSVTFVSDYANYYFVMAYAAFSPDPLALYLGDADIVVAEDKSCGLSDAFYAKETKDGKEVYKVAGQITENLKWNSALPYSGPYTVKNYDESTKTATLEINPNYPGDDARGTASIKTITYVKIISETQNDQFTTGKVDVLAGITGGDETKAALAIVNGAPDKYKETHYDRAGYGKLGFRADFGPTAFKSVRQAIMHTINRNEFATQFTGGYGSVVHGPYYTGYSAYKATEKEMTLNVYTYSVDSAIAALEEGGWIYNDKGQTYDAAKDAIRYKKLSGYELTLDNLHFKTVDNKYKTLKINGEYYMPLAINWYGTQPNNVTDMLKTSWMETDAATKSIGMYITYTECDFTTGLYGEYMRDEGSGYNGVPKLNAINFATGFTSAAYDYSFNWSISPDYLAYSINYVFDEADFIENYKADAE